MKMGTIQGRLLKPKDGAIQEFPDDWKDEFILLDQIGLNHVEWIVTAKSFANNPIFSEDCKDYKISSLCADNIVDSRFNTLEFLRENLDPICLAAQKNKIGWITVPLLEESDITDSTIRKKFMDIIVDFANKYPELNFSFEAETHWDNILELVSLKDNFWITYDTGNITSQGFNHKEYLTKVIEKISNVHIKDRTYQGQTVRPLTGDTDFIVIFNTLRDLEYNGLYTLQTARGSTGSEPETMKRHKEIFGRIIDGY